MPLPAAWTSPALKVACTASMRQATPCCRYCATLGYVAGALIAEGKTGLMATASCLDKPCADWSVGGCPLINMMCIERRRGK